MQYWNHIYEHFDPIAFSIFSLPVHWYGMMYVLALVSALFMAKWIIKKDNIDIEPKEIDDYFIYIEIGIILGARLGYIIFYDPNNAHYLTEPWNIFNPFNAEGEFVGIRGMSYHGAVIGWFLGSIIYYKRRGINFGRIMDIVAISVPLGYAFGRIGNFLNQELVGRTTDASWGIIVEGVLRHPSQLYESFLEGILIFIIIYAYRKHKQYEGQLILLYGFLYGLMRPLAEIWRQPDPQIGFICCDFLTMGMFLSFFMAFAGFTLNLYFLSTAKRLKP